MYVNAGTLLNISTESNRWFQIIRNKNKKINILIINKYVNLFFIIVTYLF